MLLISFISGKPSQESSRKRAIGVLSMQARHETWRGASSLAARRTARRVRGGLLALLFAAGVGLLLYVVIRPAFHPNTHLVVIAGDGHEALGMPLPTFATNSIAGFDALRPVLYQAAARPQPHISRALRSPLNLDRLWDELADASDGSRDVVIYYVTAPTIVYRGKPCLICDNFSTQSPTTGLYEIAELLSHIAASSAKVKLLILESQTVNYDPRLGVLTADFAQQLDGVVSDWGNQPPVSFEQIVADHDKDGDQQISRDEFPTLWSGHPQEQVEPRVVRFNQLDVGHDGELDAHDWSTQVSDLERVVSYQPATADGSTWVLHGHSIGERSHTDHASQLPLFTQAIQQGLLGAADADADSVVDLRELHAYAAHVVAYRVNEYSAGRESQRPTLLRTGGLSPSTGYSPPLVSLRPLLVSREDETQQDETEADVATPQETVAHAMMALTSNAAWFQAGVPNTEVSPEAAPATESVPETEPATASATNENVTAALDASTTFYGGATPEQQLVSLWKLRDMLESRSHLRVSPIDVTPHLWRQAVARMQRVENLRVAGLSEKATAEARRLYRSLAPLAALLDSSVSPPQTSNKLGASIAEQLVANADATVLPLTPAGIAAFTAGGTRDDLTKWLTSLSKDELLGASPFAQRLAARPDIPWPTIQQALRTRLAEEQIGKARASSLRWVEDDVEATDRLRVHAERALLNPIDTTPEAVLVELQRAETEYRAILSHVDDVEAATVAFHDLCQRLPDYMRLYRSVGTSSNTLQALKQLDKLVTELTTLGDVLRRAEPSELGKLPRIMERLRKTRAVIETPVSTEFVVALAEAPNDPATAWWVHQLLATPLVSADARRRLHEIRQAAEAALQQYLDGNAAEYVEGATAVRSQEVIHWRNQLEREMVRLAAADLHRIEPAAERVANIGDAGKEAFLSHGVEVFYRDLPDAINDASTSHRDLSDPTIRAAAVDELRSAGAALRFVDVRDVSEAREPLHQQLRDVSRYDALVWQINRARRALAFAWPDEKHDLQEAIAVRQSLASALRDQPTITDTRPAAIDVQGPRRIELIDQTSTEVTLQIRNRSTQPLAVWAACAYDEDLCSVAARPMQMLYRDQRRAAPRRDTEQKIEPTLTIPAGATRPLHLRVERPENVTGTTEVLVKLVSANADQPPRDAFFFASDGEPLANVSRTDGDLTRDRLLQPVEVAMPLAPTIDVRVGGTPGTWSRQADGFTLHPFPNRETDYQLSLVNDTDTSEQIDVRLVATRRALALPVSTLDAESAKRLETEFLPGAETLVEMAELSLAPGQTVPVPFPDMKAAEGEDAAGLLPAAVPRDLLMIIASRTSGTTTLHRLQLAPQRPRRYVRTIVTYDPLDERLHMRVMPTEGRLLPAGGVEVRARFEVPLQAGTQNKLAGKIMGAEDEVRMYADLARAEVPQRLYIDIDGYPRAFIYEINPQTARDRIPEATTRASFRISMPPALTSFAAPAASIPVEFQIDAPVGSFSNANDFAEIGIDADLDGEFRGESPIRLVSDRQSDIAITRLGSQGSLTVRADVGDFQMSVPVDGLQNAYVNVLGAVHIGSRNVTSRPVKIFLDARPPTIALVTPKTGRTVTIGSPLGLEIGVTDMQGAGVAKVEVGLDLTGAGKFVEDPAPVEAKAVGGGVWAAEVDTAAASAGSYALLVRATDSVGNQSDYTVIKGIRVVTDEEAEQMQAAKTSRVFGQARYGSEAAAGVSMTLQAADPQANPIPAVTTDDSGHFVFAAVPAGEYQLLAEGTIRNNPVSIKLPRDKTTYQVTVKPPRDVELPEVNVR